MINNPPVTIFKMGCPHYFLKNTISHCDTLLFGKTNKMQSQLFVYKLCDPFPPIPFCFISYVPDDHHSRILAHVALLEKQLGKKQL